MHSTRTVLILAAVGLPLHSLRADDGIELTLSSTYKTGQVDRAAAQAVADDPASRRVFVVHTMANEIEILDLADPENIKSNRDFSGVAEQGTAGDLGPEGLVFVPAAQSSDERSLPIVGNEVSGSVSVFSIE